MIEGKLIVSHDERARKNGMPMNDRMYDRMAKAFPASISDVAVGWGVGDFAYFGRSYSFLSVAPLIVRRRRYLAVTSPLWCVTPSFAAARINVSGLGTQAGYEKTGQTGEIRPVFSITILPIICGRGGCRLSTWHPLLFPQRANVRADRP